MKKVFVDGYNVINSWKELKDLPLSAARDQLVEYMINYASFYDVSISVVFDAHRVSGRSQHKEFKAKVEVVYTKDSETADSYIEREVDGLGRKIEVQVVTSDNLEQQIIFGRGAQRISSKEFRVSYFKAEEQIRKRTENLSYQGSLKLSDLVDEESRKKLEKMRRNG